MFYLFYTSLVELKYKYRYISPPPLHKKQPKNHPVSLK